MDFSFAGWDSNTARWMLGLKKTGERNGRDDEGRELQGQQAPLLDGRNDIGKARAVYATCDSGMTARSSYSRGTVAAALCYFTNRRFPYDHHDHILEYVVVQM
jgi:hypothetical protein